MEDEGGVGCDAAAAACCCIGGNDLSEMEGVDMGAHAKQEGGSREVLGDGGEIVSLGREGRRVAFTMGMGIGSSASRVRRASWTPQ